MSDLISRQAAIDFVAAGHLCNPNEPRWSDNEVVNFLKSRPSAQPGRKKGKWVDCVSSEHWKCSCCETRASYWFNEENSSGWDKDMSEWLSDFCPNCGADMRGEEDG